MKSSSSRWLWCLVVVGIAGLARRPAFAQEERVESRPTTQPVRAGVDSPEIDDVLREIDNLRRRVDALRARPAAAAAEERRGERRGPPTAAVDESAALPESWIKELSWRSIGPAGMGGRITAIAAYDADPTTYWIATASGGLLKTTNGGVTFEHQFDHEATVSIGDVACSQSNPQIVWVGTGEANPRNSVSWGDGVYKSVDGGKTWTNMGLRATFQIGRIAIHPTNPDIVYVGALGRLYGPNEERGLFKTTDGGKSWTKVHYVDDKTGVIDVAMHPRDPETLIIATQDRQRDGFDSHRGTPRPAEGYDGYDPIRKWGPGAGLWKTVDGGKSWKRLSTGLPSSQFGRCDVDWFRADPNVLYAIIDCAKIGMGPAPSKTWLGVQGEDIEGGAKLTQVTEKSPAAKAGLKVGDVVRVIDDQPIAAYLDLTAILRRKSPGDHLKFAIERGTERTTIDVALEERTLGAASAGQPTPYLGVTGVEKEGGIEVTEVAEKSPAAKAGIKVGDLLRAADGDPLESPDDLAALVATKNFGERVNLEVLREQKSLAIAPMIEERAAAAQRGAAAFAGLGGPQGALANLLGIGGEETPAGIKVTRLVEDRCAEKAGILENDVLESIDARKIASSEALAEILREKKEGDRVVFSLTRGAEKKDVTVTLEPPGGLRLRPFEYMYAGQAPNVQNRQGAQGYEHGGVYKSVDGGESWTRVNSLNPRPMYFSQIRVDPIDARYVYVLGVAQHRSKNGGKTFTEDAGEGVHADGHALWIDPRDGRHMIVGSDGGFYETHDRAKTWAHLNHMAIGQFYHVAVDSRRPYWVYGGLQDNGSWGGPSRSLSSSGTLNEDWISIGGGDGFVCRVDAENPDIVYSESQDGSISRRDLRTGAVSGVAPRPEPGKKFRFNWNTPFILSTHNAGIFYCAGNYVLRSIKQGGELRVISPEISRTGRGTATAVSESPINQDVLWTGTDDGNLWVTKNGGVEWTNVVDKVGLPGPRWVATIEASRFAEGRCYVAFDAHRADDDQAYVFVTEDYGATWKSIVANLPRASTRCLREDLKVENLLYCGNEFGAFASINRGRSWARINNNLPTVAVHEIAQHPTAGEIAAATHGRSVWVLDVSALRQMTPEAVAAAARVYEPQSVIRWRTEPQKGYGSGQQHYFGQNPPRGARIAYSLAKKAESASLEIYDIKGDRVAALEVSKEPGLHVASWDLAREARERGGAEASGARREGAAREARESGSAQEREGAASRPAAESEGAASRPRGEGPGRRRRFPRDEAGAESRPEGEPRRRERPSGEDPGADRPTTAPTTSPSTAPTSRPTTQPAARPGGRGGARSGRGGVPAGVYRVVLKVDGEELTTMLRIELDPTLPVDVASALDELPDEDESELSEEELEERGEELIFLEDEVIDD